MGCGVARDCEMLSRSHCLSIIKAYLNLTYHCRLRLRRSQRQDLCLANLVCDHADTLLDKGEEPLAEPLPIESLQRTRIGHKLAIS